MRLRTATIAGVLTLAALSDAWAQDTDFAQRGPRFLAASNAGPVKVDASRTPILRKRIAVDLQDVTIEAAITAIAQESGLRLQYAVSVLPSSRTVSLRDQDITVAAALTEILLDADVDVLFSRNGNAALIKRSDDAQRRVVGTIAGLVSDSVTREGLSGVTVLVNQRRSTITGPNGRYAIDGVPAGTHSITARRLGYATRTVSATVNDDATTTIDVVLARSATALKEIVVTPTGDRERLEVGNAVGTIKADSIVQFALIRNMSDLLQARTPGVVVSNTTGLVGAPSRIRIRGVNSTELNNDPILIVDGVRVVSQATQSNAQAELGSVEMMRLDMISGGSNELPAPSRLDDIDPSSIESIDILRGPSAASLYGTEAANGVIVIKTKRGTTGPWRLNLVADAGTSAIPGTLPNHWFGWGRTNTGAATTNCVLFTVSNNVTNRPNVADGTCTQDSVTAFNPANHPDLTTLGRGNYRNIVASISGGSPRLSQYFSVRGTENVGIPKMSNAEQRRWQRMTAAEPPSWVRRPNGEDAVYVTSRTNGTLRPGLDIAIAGNATYRKTLLGATGLPDALFGNDPTTSANDTLGFLPAEEQVTRQSSTAKHGIGAVTLNYVARRWLTLRAVGGADYTLRSDEALALPQSCTLTALLNACRSGRASTRGETFVSTIDVGAQTSFTPRPWLTTRTSVGEQMTRTRYSGLTAGSGAGTNLAFGTTLLSPSPVPLSSGDALFEVSEARDELATAGWYIDQSVAIRERLFLSAGFRRDAGSAFGSDVKTKPPIYPKVNASWLISEESFFPRRHIERFRVRAAYGHAGVQATQGDVTNNYLQTNALGPDGVTLVPGITLWTVGNPNLRPERTIEWEGGFDAGFLSGERIIVDVTLYQKRSRDAIMSLATPGSYGTTITGGQRRNVGSVENRGAEVSLIAKPLQSRRVDWEVLINASRNTNRLLSKDTSISRETNFVGQLVEGRPIRSYFGFPVVSYADADGDGVLSSREIVFGDTVVYVGAPYPTSEITYQNTFTLYGGALRFIAGVNQINGLTNRLWVGFAGNQNGARAWTDPSTPLATQAAAWEALQNGAWLVPTTTVRLSELSMTFVVPRRLGAKYLRAQVASVTIAGRNLGLWTNYVGKDPNVNAGVIEATADIGRSLPQPRSWTMRVNVGY